MKRIKKVVVLSDDFDGSEENIETIVYAFDGKVYEIDLNAKNAEKFRRAMAPFEEVSRKTTKAHLLRTLPKATGGRPRSVPAGRARREEVKETIPETPEAPEIVQGLESQALLEPGGTQVPPTPSKAPDFQDADTGPADVPQPWRSLAPEKDEHPTKAVQKARVWAKLMGRPIKPTEKVTSGLMSDWRAFYIKRLWTLVEPAKE